jgi:hypothetical protein
LAISVALEPVVLVLVAPFVSANSAAAAGQLLLLSLPPLLLLLLLLKKLRTSLKN